MGFGVVFAKLAKSSTGDMFPFKRSESTSPSTLFCKEVSEQKSSREVHRALMIFKLFSFFLIFPVCALKIK